MRPASAQTNEQPSAGLPSILRVPKNGTDGIKGLSLQSKLARLQPLERIAGPRKIVKSSVDDFVSKMSSESQKQDATGEGIVFQADGIEKTSLIEHEWPLQQKLYDFLISVAERNKFHLGYAGDVVVLCSDDRFLELEALQAAKVLRAKVIAGGEWQSPSKEMKAAISEFLPLIQRWSAIAWNVDGEFVFEHKPFSCVVARVEAKEILLLEEKSVKAGKVVRNYLIPLKQAKLIAEGFFDDGVTFIQFADDFIDPPVFEK